MKDKAFLIDTSKCMGCRGCQVACKQWNQLPAEATVNTGSYENPPTTKPNTYTKVAFKEVVEGGSVKWLFRKEQCMHCTDAACVNSCPVDAQGRNEYGLTEIDKDKCIGCGLCAQVCPFQMPKISEATKKASKCWVCLDRISEGMEPACAKACPTDAISFGDREEMLALGRNKVAASKDKKLYLYGTIEFGGLHVMYVLPEPPEIYGLPQGAAALNKFELYTYLEEKFRGSPIRDEVLTAAALKYFGNVRV
ncbi:MAG: 4Fe-4S dicluster domain-containing protein [Chloroflexota bacterium]